MNILTNNPISKRVAVISAVGIAVANAVSGIIQLTDEQSSQTTIVGIEHVTITCLSVTCLLLIPVLFYIAGMTGRKKGAVISTVGCVALALLSTSSNIRGEDYGFFPAVAVPSNLAILVGFIVTAVAMVRHTDAPKVLSIGLPVMWFVALPLSAIGGGLLVAAYWIAFAWHFEHDRIASIARNRSIAPPAAATA